MSGSRRLSLLGVCAAVERLPRHCGRFLDTAPPPGDFELPAGQEMASGGTGDTKPAANQLRRRPPVGD